MILFLLLVGLQSAVPQGEAVTVAARQHLKRGYELAEKGDLKPAEAELRQAIRVAPNYAAAVAFLGAILFRQGNLGEANSYFERALRLDPADLGTRYNLALSQTRLGEDIPAKTNLEWILKAKPGHPQARLLLGTVLERRGEDARAVELLESAPDLLRQAPDAIMSLARCYYRADKDEKAHQTLELLLGHPAGPEATFAGARTAAQAGDLNTAERLFESIRSSYPDQVTLEYELALAQYNAGRFADSRSQLLKTINSGARDTRLVRLLAWTYQRENRTEEAARTMMQAVELDPSAEAGYTEFGMLLLEQGRYTQAYDVAAKALERMPNSAAAYRVKGLAEGYLQSLRQALKSFTRAVELDPGDAEALLLVGQAEANLWMIPEATATLQKGIARFPRNARFHETYGRMLLQPSAQPDAEAETRARALLEKALALDSSLPDTHHELGKLLLRQGNAVEALPHLEAAAKLKPKDGKYLLTLANVYRELEREDDYRNALEAYRTLQARENQKQR